MLVNKYWETIWNRIDKTLSCVQIQIWRKSIKVFLCCLFFVLVALLATISLHFLYNSLSHFLRTNVDVTPLVWLSSPFFLFLDRSTYASVYVIGGAFLFYKVLPRLQISKYNSMPPLSISSLYIPPQEKQKNTALFHRRSYRFLYSIFFACLLFSIIFLLDSFIKTFLPALAMKIRNETVLHTLLKKDSLVFFWHIVFSAWITALLEEFFYRACLQRYLTDALQNSCIYLNGKRGILLSIFISSLAFAAVHPHSLGIMIIPGIIFGILFWWGGLFSAFTAHGLYNSLILLVASK